MSKPIPVDRAQVDKAARALLKHLEVRKQETNDSKPQLFDEDDTIMLLITLRKIPDRGQTKPIIVPLKHSLWEEEPEICLFVKDPKQEAKAILEKQNVLISKVINISKLKKEYHRFEERRKLMNTYQLFLTDDRILPLLPRVLGSTFFKRKKQPVPINLKRDNINAQIQAIRRSTLMFISAGDCIAVKIALSTHTPEQVTENIMFALERIVKKLKGEWHNVQALHLKSTDSIALPFYASLPKTVLRVKPDAEAAATHVALPAPTPATPSIAAAKPTVTQESDDEDDEIQVKSSHKTLNVKKTPAPKGQDGASGANPAKRKAASLASPSPAPGKKAGSTPGKARPASAGKPKATDKKAKLR